MKNSHIELLPVLPKELKNASLESNLAVFIGAGISRLLGCWGWGKLADSLIESLYKEKLIKFKEKTSLLSESNRLTKITIAKSIFSENRKEEIFFNVLEKSLKYEKQLIKNLPNQNVHDIYDYIYNLGGLNITTNGDALFHKNFIKENIIYNKEEFKPELLETDLKNTLIKIHGSITSRKTMVFSLSEYINRYKDDFLSFINEVFDKYRILFIGYGLEELDLLRPLVNSNPKEMKHFLLKAFYLNEDRLLTFYKSYFKELGINVIGYALDEKGYDQIIEIIKEWGKEIKESRSIEEFSEIDNLLKD